MDFFNSKPTTTSSPNVSDGRATPGFQQALDKRFSANTTPSLLTSVFTPSGALPTPMLPSVSTARALNRPAAPRLPTVPQGALAGPSTTPMPSHKYSSANSLISPFVTLLPEHVVSLTNTPDVLLIDIRPHYQFQNSRLPGAVSLVVPSTLLKRPTYSLEKMAEAIEPKAAQDHFSKWRSMKKLVVYDLDSSFLVDGSNLAGLLRKFHVYGYRGELAWVKGGFSAISRAYPSLIDTTVQETTLDDVATENHNAPLRARDLSTHAFQQSSTTLVGQRTPKGSEHLKMASSAPVAANPFYDNIRQNVELSQGVDTRIPLLLPPEIIARKNDLPFKWLRDIVDNSIKDKVGDTLAMQFYRVELGEQRRMQRVMDHHSVQNGANGSPSGVDDYPYSITAGIEMGTKNRYQNIWPFEHARVRLPRSNEGSDYFNASFVQPLVSSRRYIATQGPMDSTYDDFWAICWAQAVPVIVMLTQEIESSLSKCGKYWRNGKYGDIDLKLVLQRSFGGEKPKLPPSAEAFSPKSGSKVVPDTIIERVFELRNDAQPHIPPRKITHLQYLGWPDMDVPSTPGGLLTLIRCVDMATNEHIDKALKTKQGPVLLHCSAGVGRTGGFLLVDAILAGIRREMMRSGSPFGQNPHQSNSSPDEMDIDGPELVISPGKPTRSYPDEISSHSSAPRSTSGSESALKSTNPSPSSSTPSRNWSKRAVEGSSTATESSPITVPEPRKMSNLLVENLKKAGVQSSPSSSKAQVVAWSKNLVPSSAGSRETLPDSVGSISSPEESQEKGSVNYKLPRKRDDLRGSPPMLSSFAEPIREVLEDMREQRMSLCQSLRQYVFAHRAIVKGALDLVDEAAEAKRATRTTGGGSGASIGSELAWSSTSSVSSTGEEGPPPLVPTFTPAGHFSFGRERSRTSSIASSSPPSRSSIGKRSASPARINSGDASQPKRLFLRRKHKTGDSQNDSTPRTATKKQHASPGSSRDR